MSAYFNKANGSSSQRRPGCIISLCNLAPHWRGAPGDRCSSSALWYPVTRPRRSSVTFIWYHHAEVWVSSFPSALSPSVWGSRRLTRNGIRFWNGQSNNTDRIKGLKWLALKGKVHIWLFQLLFLRPLSSSLWEGGDSAADSDWKVAGSNAMISSVITLLGSWVKPLTNIVPGTEWPNSRQVWVTTLWSGGHGSNPRVRRVISPLNLFSEAPGNGWPCSLTCIFLCMKMPVK